MTKLKEQEEIEEQAADQAEPLDESADSLDRADKPEEESAEKEVSIDELIDNPDILEKVNAKFEGEARKAVPEDGEPAEEHQEGGEKPESEPQDKVARKVKFYGKETEVMESQVDALIQQGLLWQRISPEMGPLRELLKADPRLKEIIGRASTDEKFRDRLKSALEEDRMDRFRSRMPSDEELEKLIQRSPRLANYDVDDLKAAIELQGVISGINGGDEDEEAPARNADSLEQRRRMGTEILSGLRAIDPAAFEKNAKFMPAFFEQMTIHEGREATQRFIDEISDPAKRDIDGRPLFVTFYNELDKYRRSQEAGAAPGDPAPPAPPSNAAPQPPPRSSAPAPSARIPAGRPGSSPGSSRKFGKSDAWAFSQKEWDAEIDKFLHDHA